MSLPEHKRIIPHLDISEQALRELEIWLLGRLRTVRASGGGIQFVDGTYGDFNVGNSLNVETNAPAPGVSGGMNFVATNGAMTLSVNDDSGMTLSSGGGGLQLLEDGGGIVIQEQSNGGINLVSAGGSITIADSIRDVNISAARFVSVATEGEEIHSLGSSGSTFVINDHLGSPLVTYTG